MRNVINDRRNVLDIYQIIRICKAYRKLGWFAQDNLDNLIAGQIDVDPGTIDMIEGHFLPRLPPDARELLDTLIAEFRRAQE